MTVTRRGSVDDLSPDRTGASIRIELGGAGAEVAITGAACGLGSAVLPRVSDGMRPSMQDGSAPSTPKMRMSRLLNSSSRPRKASLVSGRSETSITTDLPVKNPCERARSLSISVSQASIGVSGLTTSAWNVPPRNLKEVRFVVISLTSRHRTALVVNDWLICGNRSRKSRRWRRAANAGNAACR